MLQKYKKYLVENYPSKNTIINYISVLEKFLSQFPFTREGVQKFIQQLRDQGMSSSTINIKLSALKNYNDYLLITHQIEFIIINKRDRIKIQDNNTSPNELNLSQIQDMLQKARDKDSFRNFTILYLIVSTGIRREECVNLLVSNITLTKGEMVVIGKGNKERVIYLNDKINNTLNYFINSVHRNKESKYLFTTRKSLKMNEKTINVILKKYNINPHKLRHFWAAHNLDNGLTIEDVRNQLGHASLHTTSKYLRPNKETFKDKINKTSI